MTRLSVSTSLFDGLLALETPQGVFLDSWNKEQGSHSELLLPRIERLRQKAGIEKNSIEELFLDIGPGSFTGLRVSLGFAKALGLICGEENLRIQTHTSLELLASHHIHKNPKTDAFACAVYAFRDLYYTAEITKSPDGLWQSSAPKCLTVADLKENSRACVFWQGQESLFSGLNVLSHHAPNAEMLAITHHQFATERQYVSWRHLAPLYVRESEPEEKRRASQMQS